MILRCPHNYSAKATLGNISLEWSDVSIFADICDHADCCGVTHCEFYDVTSEGTRRYMQAMLRCEADIYARLDDKTREARYQARREAGVDSLSDTAHGWTEPMKHAQ